jgi:hypothetical protein
MGIYGVEEEFWVDEYHFEVSFSSDNTVGLCQRDVTVGHRRKVEDLALTDFTGLQLLEAYTGPDRVLHQETFAHQIESLRASYKEARQAPHANSTRLLRHEKKDLKRLEKTLAQELSSLDRGLFDLSRVQDQVQHTEHHHLLRTGGVDSGMEEVATAWNAIPGVVVSSSCQGTSGVVNYAGKTLLVPSGHDECAHVVVVLIDESLTEVIEHCRSAFPHICSTQFYRPVGSYRAAPQKHCQLRSGAEADNTRVRQDLVTIALEVRAQWLQSRGR